MATTLAIKKRCPRCRQYLRPNGTCQNPNCVRYVPENNTSNDEIENKSIGEE